VNQCEGGGPDGLCVQSACIKVVVVAVVLVVVVVVVV